MPPAKRMDLGLLDSVIVLILGCVLALLILWAGSQINGVPTLFSNLPDWLSKVASNIWTYATGGASSIFLAWLRRRSNAPTPNYLLWTGGTTIVVLLLVFFVPSRRPDPPQGWLYFSLKCDKPQHPNLSFSQRQPRWKESHNIAAETDGNYKEFVDFPGPAARFYGRAVRIVSDSQVTQEPSTPTEFCFKRKSPSPSNNPPKEAHLDCSEGKRCSTSNDDPGWFESCSSESDWKARIELLPMVYADEKAQPGWRVPSLETLQKMSDRERVGYTQFTIQSSQLGGLKADTLQYLIKANGSPLYVDGWGPNDMLKPFDATTGFTFSFGLENLNFSGVDGGCENIQLDLSFRQQGRVIKQVKLSRKYAALRDADPEDVKSEDGTTFAWSGKYVKPKNEDTSEVFGLTTPYLQNAQRAKDQLDAARLAYDGMEVVGVLRPPLDKPNYGIVVGLRQPSGQVRFTFDKTTANGILNWILRLPASQKSVLRQNAFIYQMKPGESGTGELKSCSSHTANRP